MNQSERRLYLINAMLDESPRYGGIEIPKDTNEQKQLLRSLMNVRMPAPISEEFLRIQDEYLRQAIAEKGITELSDLTEIEKDIYLWQGDITTIKCGAIVNAANSQMLGCFSPCHGCIDNAIPYLITHRPITSFKASA
ncbi:MAG: protein in Tap1-dppD intergenic region [Ruminococcus sp.]|nr:protein in Tap1-dppD intergenic region [Ruminococcus sp.]